MGQYGGRYALCNARDPDEIDRHIAELAALPLSLLLGLLAAVAVLAQQAVRGEREQQQRRLVGARRRTSQAQGTWSTARPPMCCSSAVPRSPRHSPAPARRLRPAGRGLTDRWSAWSRSAWTARAMSSAGPRRARGQPRWIAALGSRMLVNLAGAAAWFNWVHAPRGVVGFLGRSQFFRACPVGRRAVRPGAGADPPCRAP